MKKKLNMFGLLLAITTCAHPEACILRTITHLQRVLNATTFQERQAYMEKAFARLQDASTQLF